MLAVTVPFMLNDKIFGHINYLFPALHVICKILLFFIVCIIICTVMCVLQKLKAERNEQE